MSLSSKENVNGKRVLTYKEHLTKNFNIHEFECHDGTPVPQVYFENVLLLAANLQVIRNHFDEPLIITSGFRTIDYNKKIGGSPKSQHLLAKAADFKTKIYHPETMYFEIEHMIEKGELLEGGLGLYNTFIHYDIRGTKARWDFRTK